jgi:hypothetical protein
MAVWSATLSPHARHDAALRATKSSRFRHATRQRGGGCGRISPGDSGRGHVNGCGGRVRVPHTCPPCESPMPDPCPVRCCVPRPPHIGGSLLAGKRAGIAVLTSPLLPTYDLSFFFFKNTHTHTTSRSHPHRQGSRRNASRGKGCAWGNGMGPAHGGKVQGTRTHFAPRYPRAATMPAAPRASAPAATPSDPRPHLKGVAAGPQAS